MTGENLIEVLRVASEDEAQGFAFTLGSVGLKAKALHVWEAEGRTPGWHWAVLVPAEEEERARKILAEEHPPGKLIPLHSAERPREVKRPPVYWTVGLAVVCLLVWLAMEGSGGSQDRGTLLRFGASHAPSVLGGEVWRTVTAVFLHIGFKHLLANTLSLLLFGIPVLHRWGPGRMYALFLGSAVAGNWISLALSPTGALKAGASGGILGLLGALAGDRIREIRRPSRRPSRFKTWHVLAMLLAYYGFMVGVGESTDHLAHLGGLAAGIGLGLILPALGTIPPKKEKRLAWGCGVGAVTFAVASAALQFFLG